MDFLCTDCQLPKQIQNKKYQLCSDCVFKRNHNGKSQTEVYLERESLKEPKPIKLSLPKKKKPKRVTTQQLRQKEISTQLSLLKQVIREEAIENDCYYCEGCSRSDKPLDCSHILSVKQYKSLELERENIQLLCRSCHLDWESWNLEKMLKLICFYSNYEYIRTRSKTTFGKLTVKLEEYNVRRKI